MGKIRVIDLFSGCGGMSLGFQNAGFEIIAAYDNWKPAVEVYEKNFEHPIYSKDLSDKEVIHEIKQLNPDMIIGGPPCQDFSIAGKRDFNGRRANMTIIFSNIIAECKPKWFVMENVYNIEKTSVLEEAIAVIKSAGYGITKRVFDASYMGVPQMRKRFFMIGKLGEKDDFLKTELEADLSDVPATVKEVLGNKIDTEFYYMHPRSYNRRAIFSVDEPSSTIRGVNRPMPSSYQPHSADKTDDLQKVRSLTTKERSYIQTFPEDFEFTGSKSEIEQMIGNAVPVKMAQYIGEHIYRKIEPFEIDTIESDLKRLEYHDFKQYVNDLLTACNIPNATINKTLGNFREGKPIRIYQRAIIYQTEKINDKSVIDSIDDEAMHNARLLIAVNKVQIVAKDNYNGNTISCHPEDIHNHVDFFLPLIYGNYEKRSSQKTIDFASSAGSLLNRLRTENTCEPRIIIDYVLALMYIGFARSIIQDKEIDKYLAIISTSTNAAYEAAIEGIIQKSLFNKDTNLRCKKLTYLGIRLDLQLATLPILDSKTYALSTSILKYDYSDIDTEMLGPLLYEFLGDNKSTAMFGHYTSYKNVDRLISPLFVNEYKRRIEANKNNKKELNRLAKEISSLKFFDPTNGPGCFLTASFRKITELEKDISELLDNHINNIKISNYISVVDEYASYSLTKLSLWVTYLQYLKETDINIIDLGQTVNELQVIWGNPLTTEWQAICPKGQKVFVLGAPTFKGAKKCTPEEKSRMREVFNVQTTQDIDYCSCWLYLGAKYINNTDSRCAFVLTNSVVQGSQVNFLWTRIYKEGCDIAFAHRSFKWKNGAGPRNEVTVVIIGLVDKTISNSSKYLYDTDRIIKTEKIGPYLINGTDIIVCRSTRPLSDRPLMQKGNMPYDNNYLLLNQEERNRLLAVNPTAEKFLKRIVGSKEYLHNINRWCLWIEDYQLQEALEIPEIADRIAEVCFYRESKADRAAQKLSDKPYQFREFRSTTTQSLVVPSVSSENRPYIPIGFIDKTTIISNLAFAVYDCEPWIFGIISSRMHMAWIRSVCGGLETRLRYSNELGYNTFPFPRLSTEEKKELTSLVHEIIVARENYCDISLGKLYNNLPPDLKMRHEYLDTYIDSLYQTTPFRSDMERVRLLLELYDKQRNRP